MGEIGLFTRLDRAIINFGGSSKIKLKNAHKTVDCYLKAITDFFNFHFKVSVFFDQVAQYMDITVS